MKSHLLLQRLFLVTVLFILSQSIYAKPITLNVIETTLMIDGKASSVFAITRSDGKWGYEGNKNGVEIQSA